MTNQDAFCLVGLMLSCAWVVAAYLHRKRPTFNRTVNRYSVSGGGATMRVYKDEVKHVKNS